MIHSVLLGLLAALCWGLHDVCVRFVSQRAGILSSMMTVMVTGAVLVAALTLYTQDWHEMTARAALFATASGLVFAGAGYALYRAFAIGPVRLVAPLIGAYPILSVVLAMVQGQPVSWDQWAAVLMVVAGVGAVAAWADEGGEDGDGHWGHAVAWSLLAALGFFATFGLGQAATAAGPELPGVTITRLAAILALFALATIRKEGLIPNMRVLPLLLVMGALDAIALSAVMVAGNFPRPEFASVTSSLFGALTVVLAWAFLRESMRPRQWAAVAVTFAGVAWLGL